jgi:hypothetical protein
MSVPGTHTLDASFGAQRPGKNHLELGSSRAKSEAIRELVRDHHNRRSSTTEDGATGGAAGRGAAGVAVGGAACQGPAAGGGV